MQQLIMDMIYKNGVFNNTKDATKGYRALIDHIANIEDVRACLATYITESNRHELPPYIHKLMAMLLRKVVDTGIVPERDMIDILVQYFLDEWSKYRPAIPFPDAAQYYIELLQLLPFNVKVAQIEKFLKACQHQSAREHIPFTHNMMLRKLIRSIDFNERNDVGSTILMDLAGTNLPPPVYYNYLTIKRGADPFAVNKYGYNIIHYCKTKKCKRFFSQLFKKGELRTMLSTRRGHPLHDIPSDIFQKKIAPYLFSRPPEKGRRSQRRSLRQSSSV